MSTWCTAKMFQCYFPLKHTALQHPQTKSGQFWSTVISVIKKKKYTTGLNSIHLSCNWNSFQYYDQSLRVLICFCVNMNSSVLRQVWCKQSLVMHCGKYLAKCKCKKNFLFCCVLHSFRECKGSWSTGMHQATSTSPSVCVYVKKKKKEKKEM